MRKSANYGELFSRVQTAIARHEMLRAGDRVGIAISGGADSIALALILKRLQSQLGVNLSVVHFNHQLRGADSDGDEDFVREFAMQQSLEFVSGGEDVAARARENRWNLEDAARRLRYAFFASIVSSERATTIAVAHTANDQAETLFAQIVRGTGPTGLAGIYPVAHHVIRPLLEVRGEQLREFLRGINQSWREDLTNKDESRLRSRIRHRLLPLIESEFQPKIVENAGRLADLAREDAAFWQLLVEDRFNALVARRGKQLSISKDSLLRPISLAATSQSHESTRLSSRGQPYGALTKRLVRRIFEELKGTRAGLTSAHVNDVIALGLTATSGSRIDLPAGVVVEKSFDELIFTRARTKPREKGDTERRAAAAFLYGISLPDANASEVLIPEIGHRLCLKVIDWPAATRETSNQAIDWESLRAPLVVRNWQPGDAFRPHGRLREHKLKELLRVKRIPVRERAAWPVLTSAGSVVWSRGFPVAESFASRSNSRRGVLVVEEPI